MWGELLQVGNFFSVIYGDFVMEDKTVNKNENTINIHMYICHSLSLASVKSRLVLVPAHKVQMAVKRTRACV